MCHPDSEQTGRGLSDSAVARQPLAYSAGGDPEGPGSCDLCDAQTLQGCAQLRRGHSHAAQQVRLVEPPLQDRLNEPILWEGERAS
jgi:hypothetical protein